MSPRLFAWTASTPISHVDTDRLDPIGELEAKNLTEEGQFGLQRALKRLRPANAVPFFLEDKVSEGDAAPAKPGDYRLRLVNRDNRVLEPLQEKYGRRKAVDCRGW